MPLTPCDAQYAPKYGCYCDTCRPLRKHGFLDRDAPGEVLSLPPSPAKLLTPEPPLDPRAIAARVEIPQASVPAGHVYNHDHTYHPDQDYHYWGGF